MFGVGIQLNPGEQFPLTYQIADPLDVNTYYVRSIIWNSITRKVLATIPLVDRGNGFFSQNYLVPADPSGNGTYINIRTEVYTDSGYTTPSPNYEVDSDAYLIQTRVNPVLYGSSGGDYAVDYRRMGDEFEKRVPKPKRLKELERIIVIEELLINLAAAFSSHEALIAEQMQVMIENTMEAIGGIHGRISKMDFDPARIEKAVSAVEEIRNEVAQHGAIVNGLAQDVSNSHEAHQHTISELFDDLRDDLRSKIEINRRDLADTLNRNLADIDHVVYTKVPLASKSEDSETSNIPKRRDPKEVVRQLFNAEI